MPYTPSRGMFSGESFEDRNEYRRAVYAASHAEVPVNEQTEKWAQVIADRTDQEVGDVLGSAKFRSMYNKAERSGWSTAYNGPFAELLDYIYDVDDRYWDVGDTGEIA